VQSAAQRTVTVSRQGKSRQASMTCTQWPKCAIHRACRHNRSWRQAYRLVFAEGRVGKQYFNLRLAPQDVNDALTGYSHNAGASEESSLPKQAMLLLWCFSGLHYVVHLWFELCDCLCMPLCYIYARFYDISIGHYTWFVVTCNELTHSKILQTVGVVYGDTTQWIVC
jgi:hypothetical protein